MGSRNKATEAAELLLDGEAEALTRKAVELALEGEASALRLCLERIIPPRRERPVNLGLPAVRGTADLAGTMAAITTAAGQGTITPGRGGGTGAGCRDLRPGGRDQRFRKAAAGAGRSVCRASVTRGWLAWRQRGRASIRRTGLDRCTLRAWNTVCGLVRDGLVEAGIDPESATALQLGGIAAHLTDGETLEGRRLEEELAVGDHDGLAGIFAVKIGEIARRFRDGHEPDFASASLAELFAWCVARRDPCGG